MRAVLCRQYGPPESLTLETLPAPPLGPADVRVAIHACGVNFPDLLIIEGKYQLKPPLPFAPGGEVAGVVTETGAAVRRFKVGDRVIAVTMFGGFADEIVTAEGNVMSLPAEMDDVVGAGFSYVYGTSYHALAQRAQIRGGETLLVLGAAGGVGLAAVELGKILGATVIAAASRDDKLEVARGYGADHLVNYAREDLREKVKSLTAGRGADVVFDPVGGDASEQALRSIAWEGRLLVVGFASGRIPEVPLNRVLLKGCQIVGVFWGGFVTRDAAANARNFAQLFAWHREGRLRPHVWRTWPLEEAALALRALQQRDVAGKVVLTTTAP